MAISRQLVKRTLQASPAFGQYTLAVLTMYTSITSATTIMEPVKRTLQALYCFWTIISSTILSKCFQSFRKCISPEYLSHTVVSKGHISPPLLLDSTH